MACLYCGKRVSLVRQMADPDFCSDEHRRRYHDMARAAINRLLELDGAEATEPAERKPAVSRSDDDSHARRPEPPAQPRRTTTTQPATGTRRRGLPAAHKPPLLAEAVPPAERDIIPAALAIHDSDVVLWGEADCEFTVPVTLLDLPALWARRAPICAEFRPYRFRAAADASACRNYPALVFAPAEFTIPPGLSLVRGRALAGLAIDGFRRVEGPARRRFARPRSAPATRLIGRAVQVPALTFTVRPTGVAVLPAAPRTAAPFVHVSRPAIVEIALPSPALRLPGSPPIAAPKSRPVVNRAALESAEPCGFKAIAPPARAAAVQAPAAGAAGGSRIPDPVLLQHALCIRVEGRMGVCTALPRAVNPLAGARPSPLACDGPIQLAADFNGVSSPAPARAVFALAPGRLFPAATPAAAARMSRPQLAPAQSGSAQRAHAIPLPVSEPLAPGTGAARTGCIDTFRAILRQPRPLARPAVPRTCDTGPAVPPRLYMPVVDRVGTSFTAAGPSSPPEPPHGRKPSTSNWLPGGFARPEHPTPRPGDRKPVGAAGPCRTNPLLPARRAVRQSSPESKFTSRGIATIAAPAPRKAATTVQVAQVPFAGPAVQYANAGAALVRHQLSGHGFAPVATAPARRAANPAACDAGTDSKETLLPRPAAAGNSRPAGITAAPIRKAEPLSPKRIAATFRSEPAPAPPLQVPGASLPASAAAASIRRLIPAPGFQPAFRPDKFLRSVAGAAIAGECAFRTATALPARALRMRAACRIAQGTEIRVQRTPSAVARVPKASQGHLAALELALPGSRRMAFASSGIPAAPLSRRELSRSECPETRIPAATAPNFRLSGGVPRAAGISTPIGKDRCATAPVAAGPKAEDGARLKRRGEGAQPALATAQPIGIVVLPEFKAALPHPAYALFGFARLEVSDYDDRTRAKTRAAEALPPDPVLPRLSGPAPVLVRVPRISGVLNGYPLSHAGARALLEAICGMEIEIEPVTPAFTAVPETDEREDALAPAVPDAGRRGWGTAKRLFR